ncbi:hypothetical protein QAD02_001167 [Eretmocerus hayati]|uniref:Uncharacterized protein n=1 Tax=Eretmocerus hayati TaxID=131215 RepID=A0ACC2NFG7_9HYME|nr:hypothetical protein QAD02_001167 [Eretmocerus hayati]
MPRRKYHRRTRARFASAHPRRWEPPMASNMPTYPRMFRTKKYTNAEGEPFEDKDLDVGDLPSIVRADVAHIGTRVDAQDRRIQTLQEARLQGAVGPAAGAFVNPASAPHAEPVGEGPAPMDVKVPTPPPTPETQEAGQGPNIIREIAAMDRVRHHENVVTILAICFDTNFFYILMNLMGGSSLADMLFKRTLDDYGEPFTLSWSLDVTQQMWDGLTFLHERTIVHGDIKPENILIDDSTGEVKICDFGLAAVEGLPEAIAPPDARYTDRGTPRYMSPETLIDGHPPTQAAGVWAASCVTVEIFTRRRAWLPSRRVSTFDMVAYLRDDPKPNYSPMPEQTHRHLDRGFRRNPQKRCHAKYLQEYFNRLEVKTE